MLSTKCIPLKTQPCMVRPLNPDGPHYYPIMFSLDRCDGSYKIVKSPFGRMCVSNKNRCKFESIQYNKEIEW